MLWKYLQRTFGGGVLDKELSGRQDLAKYFQGASKIKNMLVRRQGNLQKRRGTDRVAGLENLLGRDNDGVTIPIAKMRMIPVECNDDGRFLLMTNGCAFVGNRDGIMTIEGDYVRDIEPYQALDSDGYRKVYCGKDAMANSKHPICTISAPSASGSTITWYDTLQEAYNNVPANGTVQLHADIVVESNCTVPVRSFTLDLCGYTIRINGDYGFFRRTSGLGTSAVTYNVTSSRKGAKVIKSSNNSGGIVHFIEISTGLDTGETAQSDLTVDGNIYFESLGQHSIVSASCMRNAKICNGEFISTLSTSGLELVRFYKCKSATIEDGRYEVIGVSSSAKVISCSSYNVRIEGVVVYRGITINNGNFKLVCNNANPNREYTSVFCIGAGVINGGNAESNCFLFYGILLNQLRINRLYYKPNGNLIDAEIAYINLRLQAAYRPHQNDSFPDVNLCYGWKVEGEDDYYGKRYNGDTRPYCIATPYADADLDRLCVKQVGDVLFIAHRSYAPAKITFDADGIPSMEDIVFDANKWKRPRITSAVMEGNSHTATSTSSSEVKQWVVTSSETTTNAGGSTTTNHGQWQTSTNSSSTTTTTPESPHTIKYAVTYVKDDYESMMSEPIELTYMRPWNTGATVTLNFDKGNNDDAPDYYNIYKDSGGGFGLIGSTDNNVGVCNLDVFANTEKLWTAEPSSMNLVNAMNYENRIGVGAGGLTKRIGAPSRKFYPNDLNADCFLCTSYANQGEGIKIEINSHEVQAMRFWLDGRVYDPATDTSWIVISTPRLSGQWRGRLKSRTRATVNDPWGNWTEEASATNHNFEYNDSSHYYATVPPVVDDIQMFIGFRTGLGIYEDFCGKPYKKIYLPNGNYIFASYVGIGAQTEWFNRHRRRVDINLAPANTNVAQYQVVELEYVKILFNTSVYSDWTNNQQGCIHCFEMMPKRLNSALSMEANVWQDNYVTPDMSITPPNELNQEHFAGAGDYPACVGMWGEKAQRLAFASTGNNPLGFWLSVAGDLFNFTQHKSIREDDAIEASITATEQPNINHIIAIKDLMLLTDGAEWSVSPVTGNALSYKTVSAKQHSQIGANREIEPIAVGDEMVFCNRVGEVLRAVKYNAVSENYESQDLSVLSQRIFRSNPIVSLAYKRHPDSIIECVLADGTIATLVYMREHEMAAWSVQELGGGLIAKEIGCTKSVIDGTSEMMISAVKNGVWTILKVRNDSTNTSIEDCVYMDAVQEMTGIEVLSLANEHRTVIHKLSGSVLTQDGIAAGTQSVNINDSYIVGFPFTSELVTVRPEPQGQSDTIQMELKNATEMEVRVIDSSTFRFGANGDDRYLREVVLEPIVASAGRIEFVDKDVKLPISGTNNRDGRIRIVHDSPFAFVLLSVGVTYQVEQSNQNGRGGNEG